MIDLETSSTRSDAAILTIGAIKFNSREMTLGPLDTLDTFYRRIDMDSCDRLNLHSDPDTLAWWENQGKEARHEAFTHRDRMPLGQALRELVDWFGIDMLVWANSPSFDCIILKNALRACNLHTPWDFWNERDCRTVYHIGQVDMSSIPKADHNALSDCYRQIGGIVIAMNKLSQD